MSEYESAYHFQLNFDIKADFRVDTPLSAELIHDIEAKIYEALNNVNDRPSYRNVNIHVDVPSIFYHPDEDN